MHYLLAFGVFAFLSASCDYNINVGGPTNTNSNTSTNTNSNTNNNVTDLHDVVNFVPTGNPSSPVPTGNGTGGTEVPLGIPSNAQSIAQSIASNNPGLLSRACPILYGESGWAFMDLVVRTLQSNDPRWGYLIKPSTGLVSQDVIAYRATSDNTGAWGVDIIIDVCGSASAFSWQILGLDVNAQWTGSRL